MRTSQTTLLAVILSIVVSLVVLTGLARAAITPYITNADEAQTIGVTEGTSPLEDLSEFDSVSIHGTTDVEIVQGDEWSVEMTTDSQTQVLLAAVKDGELILGRGKIGKGIHWGSWKKPGDAYRAKLTMPALKALEVSGHSKVELAGFDGDSLDVNLSGTGDISARESRYKHLHLNISGAGEIDFSDLKSVNAELNTTGTVHVELAMDGGELTGAISGMADVQYSGDVSRKDVKMRGIGKVSRVW